MRSPPLPHSARARAAVALLVAALAHAGGACAATLEQPDLPAAGRQQTVLQVERPGRVAVEASSATGVALRLVTPLGGPGAWHGAAGERDGRVDAFLDTGRYLLQSEGGAGVRGRVRLRARAFVEAADQPAQARLDDAAQLGAELVDGEQRSFLVVVEDTTTLGLEAAGRALADLRLWREGGWLLPAEPALEERQPVPGQPLRVASLQARVAPGRYLLVAYGGPALPWAVGGAGQGVSGAAAPSPLYLRRGLPRLPAVYRGRHQASPFGLDRFLVPRQSGHFRLELPLSEPASLAVGPFDPAAPYASSDYRADIDTRSRVPVASVELGARDDPGALERRAGTGGAADAQAFDVMTVQRQAGEPYTLQHYSSLRQLRVTVPGEYWLETVIAGPARDALGASALVFRGPRGQQGHALVGEAVVRLDADAAWTRQFNLTDPAELFLRVTEPGAYRLEGDGAAAAYEVLPYARPSQGEWRAQRPDASGELRLASGYYRLRIAPLDDGGVHRLTLRAAASSAPARLLPSVARFVGLRLDAREELVVQLGRGAAEDPGVQLRRLPVDLRDPPALTLDPGEELALALRAAVAGGLGLAPPGTAVRLRADAGGWVDSLRLGPGVHSVGLRNDGPAPVQVQLDFTPAAAPAGAAGAPAAAALPRLEPGQAHPLTLARDGRALLELHIPAHGLYAVQSEGLLATAARLHAPLAPDLQRVEGGGTGRNFLLQTHLEAGRYLLEVATRGESAGAATVRLQARALRGLGALPPGQSLATRLAPGEGIDLHLDVPRPGRYRLAAMGVAHRYRIMLADPAGWPLLTPGAPGEVELELGVGAHRLLVLPEALGASLVLRLEPVAPPLERSGHGPHRLALGTAAEHRWLQPAAGAVQQHDVWQFRLTAPAEVIVTTSDEMTGTLRAEASGAGLGQVSPFAPWRGQLAAGDYRLELAHLRDASRVDYRVAVESAELLPGETRVLLAPQTIWLSLPGGGVRIGSQGDADVRAELLDASGTLLARADDDGADWNFRLEQTLAAGRYPLRVLPVGDAQASTRVGLEAIAAPAAAPTGAPTAPPLAQPPVRLGRDAHVAVQAPGAGATLALALVDVAGPGLLTARSRGGPVRLAARGMHGSLLGAELGATAQLAWAAGGDAALDASLVLDAARGASVALERRDLRALAVVALERPHGLLEVAAGTALPLAIGPGYKRLQLDLPPGLVLLVDGTTLATGSARRVTVVTRAEQIWLLNAQATAELAAVGATALPGRSPGPHEVQLFDLPAPGVLRLPGPDAPVPGALHARGALQSMRLVGAAPAGDDSGGDDPARRYLELVHGAGLLAVWGETGNQDPWADLPGGAQPAPGSRVLGGRGELLALQVARAGLLRVGASTPVLLRLEQDGHPAQRALVVAAGQVDLPVWPGAARLGVRLLAGPARIDWTLAAATTLAEGLGPPAWLGPGAAAAYRFTLARPARIGLGVRSQSGQGQARLHAADGRLLGSGFLQLHELAAGDYLLVLDNPPAAAPQRLRPALVGTRPPGTEPPLEVVRRYLGLDGATPEEGR